MRFALPGCVVVALALGYVLVTSTNARIGLGALTAAIAMVMLVRHWQLRDAVTAFRNAHQPARKDLLIVYTASPHWQPYIEENWIPRWQERVVPLNRSEPDWQNRPEAALWQRLAGRNDHTPIAIVVRKRGMPRVIRFFPAFRDYKHGKTGTLQAKEMELENALRESL